MGKVDIDNFCQFFGDFFLQKCLSSPPCFILLLSNLLNLIVRGGHIKGKFLKKNIQNSSSQNL